MFDEELDDDEERRMLKPAEVVKRYREITGLHRDTPLPHDVSYSEMLAAVIRHEAGQAARRQSGA